MMIKPKLKTTMIRSLSFAVVALWSVSVHAIDWKSLAADLVEHFKPKIVSIEKLDQKSCWAVVLPETNIEDALRLAKEIGEYIKGKIPPETNPKPMIRVFVGGKQVAVAILDGSSYRAVRKNENMDPTMFKGQYRP